MSDPTDPKTPDPEPDAAVAAGEEDVLFFYDGEGKVLFAIPAEDVLMIIPRDHLLKPDKPKSFDPLIELQNRVDALQNRLDALLDRIEGTFAEGLDEKLMRMIKRRTEKTE
jgi:hypothetical protein